MHLKTEEASLSPVSTPTVADYPELNSILLSPSNYSDFMIDHWNQFSFRVNASCVGLKLLGGFNSTRNRPSSKDFCFHTISTCYSSMLKNFPYRISRSGPAVAFISRLLSFGVSTILAFLYCRATEMIGIFSKIVLTVFFRNTVAFSVCVDTCSVSSIATSSSLTVNNHLR